MRASSPASRRGSARGRRPPPAPELRPTLGPQVCRWIEHNLVHGEGDYFGQPFILRVWQRAFIYRAYELTPKGERQYDSALLGLGKGNGKTELAAAVGCAELAGPVVFGGWRPNGNPIGIRRTSPLIPVAAASFEQADLLFGAARAMLKGGRLSSCFEFYDTEILIKGLPGRMYRVAAVAGTNDGGKPTFFLGDELHEWVGRRERVYLVLSNNRKKRRGAWQLGISTAGWDMNSLLGKLVAHGRRVLAGEEQDDRFLFEWHQHDDLESDLTNRKVLIDAIRQANPAAGDFLDIDNLVRGAATMIADGKEFEFRRYFLNQWVDAPERWLPQGGWAKCALPKKAVDDGAEIVLALASGRDRGTVGLVGITLEDRPHVFVVGYWEKGPTEDSRPKTGDVEDAIREACERFSVQLLGLNPKQWPQTYEDLEEESVAELVEWDPTRPSLMIPACTQFFDDVVERAISHDGNEKLAAHLANAVVKTDGHGSRISQESKHTNRHISLAVAAVAAHDLVRRAGTDNSNDSWRPVE